ncbi:MAG TPA: AAA family ATPase, partial [Ktedonobacteraceae bacterium]|nr:AAA family ATPase [Ktedonobacteraceae bacterium]
RRDTIAQSQQAFRTLETRLVEERSRLDTVRNEEQQVVQRKQAIARAIADAQHEMERLKATLAEAERQRRTISDRLNMLKNWRQSLSGYSDGVRALLRAPTGKLSGILGPVPQLGVAPAGMEMALEAALGPYIQAVVVQTLDDAQRCLDYLQNTLAGKAMVVWLERGEEQAEVDAIGSIQWQSEEAILQRFLAMTPTLRDRVPGFAWRYIQCEQRYRSLFRQMLEGVVIAQDVQAARILLTWIISLSASSMSDLPFEAIVTLKGEFFHVKGWLTGGGSKDGGQQGLLAYERELHELPTQLEKQKELIDQVNSMLSEAQRTQEGRRAEQAALDKELQKITTRINELNRIVVTSQREQERLQTEIQLAASVEQQLATEVAALEQESKVAQERIRAHEKSQREMTGLVEELRHEMEERALVYRRQQDELGRARTALAVKRQEAKSLYQQVTVQRTQAQDMKTQVGQQVARMKDAEQRRHALLETITLHRTELEQAQLQARGLAEALQRVEGQLAEVDAQITTLERQRIQVRQTMTERENIYRRALLDSQKARDAVETLLDQLREEMGVTDPKDLATSAVGATISSDKIEGNGHAALSNDVGELSEEEEAHLRRLRRKVETLRNRLKAMGGCDLNAPQEYEEAQTRFEFLSTQIADMDQAASHLRSIIGQLDVTMARQFEVTFQAVNARFREHFTTLFNGGTARLELTSTKEAEEEAANSSVPSSMPTGVEVIVQPPGKKVQDLALLSGGERALVSAALLFALLEINPPPFCLLDEVDAALDESNVTRFCDILKRLAQRTQFIVITHNRVTMTAAQVLYGVSMKDSVSRMLSLRLEEAAVVGDR